MTSGRHALQNAHDELNGIYRRANGAQLGQVIF